MTDQITTQVAPLDQAAYRLPRTVVPERYELTLTPDLAAFTFAGEESVTVRVHAPTREILLNAIELAIQEAYLTNDQGARLDGTVTLEEADERARITLAEPVQPGAWTLHVRFSGILNDKPRVSRPYHSAPGGRWTRCRAASQ